MIVRVTAYVMYVVIIMYKF